MANKNLQSHNIFSGLCILSPIHISTLLSPASSYNLPDHHFINCGSPSPLTVYDDKPPFAADEFFSGGGATQVEAKNSSSTPPLYRNARVFLKPSSYEIRLNETGIYAVRFHFFSPSRYTIKNLHEPRFSVSALGFSLLSNLDFVNVSGSNDPPLVEEFLIKADAGRKLRVEFRPEGIKSFAFINAIELFLAPSDFIQDSPPRVTEHGEDGDHKVLVDEALHVVHRINVGGGNIARDMDTLSRYWVPDDPYLKLGNVAKNTSYNDKIEYQLSGGYTKFDAPESVYNTAKEMNINETSLISFNITWNFGVGKLAYHLIRLHFCDIVQNTSNEHFRFNLYIYSGFSVVIYPYGFVPQLAAPFYKDFVVYSDNSGLINISIGPNRESLVQTAFLNGVEIMEMIQKHRISIREVGALDEKKLVKFVFWGIGVAILIVVILSVSILYLRGHLNTYEEGERVVRVTELAGQLLEMLLDWIRPR